MIICDSFTIGQLKFKRIIIDSCNRIGSCFSIEICKFQGIFIYNAPFSLSVVSLNLTSTIIIKRKGQSIISLEIPIPTHQLFFTFSATRQHSHSTYEHCNCGHSQEVSTCNLFHFASSSSNSCIFDIQLDIIHPA